ncbi:hypothetical protein FGRMN_6470 [Fusarium graminum]|nr:hypothetical protein FGRMN_6470 [Fusarium graminum]
MGRHSLKPTAGQARPFALWQLNLHILFFLYWWAPVTAASGARYSNCSSFVTDGTASSQYDYYRFYDFRNISSDSWHDIKEPKDPNNITAGASTNDGSWQYDWVKREGYREAGPDIGYTLLPIDYQPEEVRVAKISGPKDNNAVTALTFLSSRQNESSQQSSGMDFGDENILYMSLRFRARLSGAPGACAAFFAYKNDTQEADIELLTRDSDDTVGFNTQPTLDIRGKYIPDSHWNMSMPGNASWEAWNNYRMDWVADQVVWYTNGIEMANTSVNVPSVPCRLSVSLWGEWHRRCTNAETHIDITRKWRHVDAQYDAG